MGAVPALWVHAGDMYEPGVATVVLSITEAATEIERAALHARSGNSWTGEHPEVGSRMLLGHWSTCSKIQRHL